MRTPFAIALFGCALLCVCPALAQDDELGPDDETTETQPAETAADETQSEPATESPAHATAATDVRVQAFVGFGIGTRSLRRPTKIGTQSLDDALFPAADAGLRVIAWPEHAFALAFLLRYATSIGMQVRERPPFALDNYVGVRAEHVELSAAPMFRLGDTPTAAWLSFPIGFGLRTFWPEAHKLMTPGYTLGGPFVRVELSIPLGDMLTLRFGPELQWIVLIDRSIRDEGVGDQGVGAGLEATLQFHVGWAFAFELAYREAHASAPTTVIGPSFLDIERFGTARLTGTW